MAVAAEFFDEEDQLQMRRLQTSSFQSSLSLSTTNLQYGNYGVMFYVRAISAVTITSLEIYTALTLSDAPVTVYTRPGKFLGYEVNATGWNIVYENSVTTFGTGSPTELLGFNVAIPPGSYQSFFIYCSSSRIQYDPNAVEDALYSSNTHMEYYSGAGLSDVFAGTVAKPRAMRGEIYFDVKVTEQPSTAPSTQPSSQPSSEPSSQPSSLPSSLPSAIPSSTPSSQPSSQPSSDPSSQPTIQPSYQPSSMPSAIPSLTPTKTSTPSEMPSLSSQPSRIPSLSSPPSESPSSQPSYLPALITVGHNGDDVFPLGKCR